MDADTTFSVTPIFSANEAAAAGKIEVDDIFYEEDGVTQVLNLLNFSDKPAQSSSSLIQDSPRQHTSSTVGVQEEEVFFKTESDRISEYLSKLDNTMAAEKDREIEALSRELETERTERNLTEEKLSKLVEFISFFHREFGKLLRCLITMTEKNQEVTNILNLGPFHDENEVDSFLGMMQAMSDQFQDEFENLGKAKTLLEKVNIIANAVAAASVNANAPQDIETDDGNCNDSNFSGNRSSVSTLIMGPPETEVIKDGCSRHLPSSSSSASNVGNGVPGVLKKRKKKKAKHGVDLSKRHCGHYCVCGMWHKTKGSLSNHIKYFTAERKFHCDICKKRFLYSSVLRAHMTTSHKIVDNASAKYSCSKCGKHFESRRLLFRHISIMHEKTKNEAENIAATPKLRFVKKGRSGRSRRTFESIDENGVRHGHDVYATTTNRCYCGTVYSHWNTLWVHLRTKMYAKKFQCNICLERFDQHVFLKIHVRNTHMMEYNLGKYGCGVCGKAVNTMDELMKHRIAEHGGRSLHANKDGENTVSRDNSEPRNEEAVEATEEDFSSESDEDGPPTLLPEPPTVIQSAPVTNANVYVEDGVEIICID